MNLPSTAILLFTRTPQEEARHKTFASTSKKTSTRIARELIKHTYTCLEQAGTPVYVIDSDRQKGETFGQRLAHAFQEIYSLGYVHVIAVGNDTLSLSTDDLQEAIEQLRSNKAVLGPTKRGGAYLIGLHRSAFESLDFAALPWETHLLFDALVNLFQEKNVSASLLKCLRDINDSADFFTVIKGLSKRSSLYKVLKGLLVKSAYLRVSDRTQRPSEHILASILHRAPPGSPISA